MAYNRMIIEGRLVRDPKLRQTGNGIAVASATVAVDRPYQKDKPKETDFVDIVAWRGSADFLAKYFSRGDAILCEGAMQSREYEDKEGINRRVWELTTDNIRFVGGKKSESSEESSEDNAEDFQNINLDDEDLPF